MDAAEYKHIVLGLILKHISDAFHERRSELEAAFADESHDLTCRTLKTAPLATEERDYYTNGKRLQAGPVRWEIHPCQCRRLISACVSTWH